MSHISNYSIQDMSKGDDRSAVMLLLQSQEIKKGELYPEATYAQMQQHGQQTDNVRLQTWEIFHQRKWVVCYVPGIGLQDYNAYLQKITSYVQQCISYNISLAVVVPESVFAVHYWASTQYLNNSQQRWSESGIHWLSDQSLDCALKLGILQNGSTLGLDATCPKAAVFYVDNRTVIKKRVEKDDSNIAAKIDSFFSRVFQKIGSQS